MSNFSKLLKYAEGEEPGEAQEKARARFARAVSRSNLSLRKPSAPISDSGRQIIVGVATYSADELLLLDELDDSLRTGDAAAFEVAVFDVRQCRDATDVARFVPGIDGVFRTPVAGVFVDGKLVDQATGLPDVVTTLRRFQVLNHVRRAGTVTGVDEG